MYKRQESTLIDYYRAELLISQGSQWLEEQDSSMRYAFNEAIEICERAIRTFPDAYGSQLCKTLIQQIEQKSVSASVESISPVSYTHLDVYKRQQILLI